MRLLSLDISSTSTGWCVFDGETLLEYGVIKPKKPTMQERIKVLYQEVEEKIKMFKIDEIRAEEVPISGRSNLAVGAGLLIMQGLILSLSYRYNIPFSTIRPSVWRKKMDVGNSEICCQLCNTIWTQKTSDSTLLCPHCANKVKKHFKKKALNKREQIKKEAVVMVNDMFNLSLLYTTNKDKTEDDIAEAILIGYEYVLEVKNYGKKNSKGSDDDS